MGGGEFTMRAIYNTQLYHSRRKKLKALTNTSGKISSPQSYIVDDGSVISASTLSMMDKAMKNYKKGISSKSIDLSVFDDDF